MLKRISKIKGYRIFQDFTWPAGLAEFARFNVIYGLNGAGKTTLSTLLRHVEQRQPIADGRVEFVFGSRTVSGADLQSEVVPKVRVFNRDFVGRAVFETGSGKLPPVYYFGEDSAEKQKRIVDLNKQINAIEVEQRKQADDAKRAVKSLDEYCTGAARGIRNLLTVAGGGSYNNYDARNFKHQAQRIQSAGGSHVRLTSEMRESYMALRDGKALSSVQPVVLEFPDLIGLRSEVDAVLRASVVSTVLDELATDQVVAGWVYQGLLLHSGDRLSTACRFCRQPLRVDRVSQIEAHFNDEFKRLKQRVLDLLAKVEGALSFERALQLSPAEVLYEKLRPQYEQAVSQLRSHSHAIKGALEALKAALVAKRDDPFQNIELESWLKLVGPGHGFSHAVLTILALIGEGTQAMASLAGAQALARINSTIAEHNRLTATFDREVNAARAALADDEVLAAFDGWSERSMAVTSAETAEKSARDKKAELASEVTRLEAEIKQHHQPAAELNDELAGYLGRSEISFVPDKNGYRLMRGGQTAHHLSDGERTAVAFLYFLKSLQGTDFDLRNGIVVIDDPVSSLDANSLFSAFGYMQTRTADAKQIFILTHNFSFFRQVQHWFKSLQRHRRETIRYFSVQPSVVDGQRAAILTDLDPFLTKFESEYQYLFRRVYEVSTLSQGQELESYYGMPNIARRFVGADRKLSHF
jgi:wobble nucleotide-excising tRNase